MSQKKFMILIANTETIVVLEEDGERPRLLDRCNTQEDLLRAVANHLGAEVQFAYAADYLCAMLNGETSAKKTDEGSAREL